MKVIQLTADIIPLVEKPWGWEKWIQDGTDDRFNYVLKQIHLNKGYRTSLQVHRFKSETIMVQSGKGILHTYPHEFDVDEYLNGSITQDQMDEILAKLIEVPISPQTILHIPRKTIHRVEALENLFYFEASSTELNDVVRIQDDLNRPNNTI